VRRAVFDASLILKWYLPSDPLFERAVAARQEIDALAPTLVLAELGNALWKYVRAGLLDVDEACAVVASVSGRLDPVPDSELIETAQRLSAELDHPVYDCLYLALARRENVPLITADRRLASRAEALGLAVDLMRAES
jgi:predicted nucleic acid-binding protein